MTENRHFTECDCLFLQVLLVPPAQSDGRRLHRVLVDAACSLSCTNRNCTILVLETKLAISGAQQRLTTTEIERRHPVLVSTPGESNLTKPRNIILFLASWSFIFPSKVVLSPRSSAIVMTLSYCENPAGSHLLCKLLFPIPTIEFKKCSKLLTNRGYFFWLFKYYGILLCIFQYTSALPLLDSWFSLSLVLGSQPLQGVVAIEPQLAPTVVLQTGCFHLNPLRFLSSVREDCGLFTSSWCGWNNSSGALKWKDVSSESMQEKTNSIIVKFVKRGAQDSNIHEDNFEARFPYGHFDQVRVPNMPDLPAFTVCFWMKSNDSSGAGTPFWYRVHSKRFNREMVSIGLLDYRGFYIYVGAQRSYVSHYADYSSNCLIWHFRKTFSSPSHKHVFRLKVELRPEHDLSSWEFAKEGLTYRNVQWTVRKNKKHDKKNPQTTVRTTVTKKQTKKHTRGAYFEGTPFNCHSLPLNPHGWCEQL